MPIDSDGKIVARTPTDQLMACLEALAQADDVTQVVVIFGRQATSEGRETYGCSLYGTTDYWTTIGLLEHAREEFIRSGTDVGRRE